MTLAAILSVCLITMASPGAPARTSSISPPPQSQASGSSQAPPAQPSSAAPQDSADQLKPAPKPHHRKKTSRSNCSTATPAPETPTDSTPRVPCPPAKKVVRHGGSNEPAVQLTGGATDEQTFRQRSAEQLRLATEENLKKIKGTSTQLEPGGDEEPDQPIHGAVKDSRRRRRPRPRPQSRHESSLALG